MQLSNKSFNFTGIDLHQIDNFTQCFGLPSRRRQTQRFCIDRRAQCTSQLKPTSDDQMKIHVFQHGFGTHGDEQGKTQPQTNVDVQWVVVVFSLNESDNAGQAKWKQKLTGVDQQKRQRKQETMNIEEYWGMIKWRWRPHTIQQCGLTSWN